VIQDLVGARRHVYMAPPHTLQGVCGSGLTYEKDLPTGDWAPLTELTHPPVEAGGGEAHAQYALHFLFITAAPHPGFQLHLFAFDRVTVWAVILPALERPRARVRHFDPLGTCPWQQRLPGPSTACRHTPKYRI
jgi:hypothetical protein